MLSKFSHFIRLKNDQYSVFNSLLFEPLVITKEEKDNLKENKLDKFTKEELELLSKKGIIVKNKDKDKKVLNTLRDYVTKATYGGISLLYIIPSNICNLACKYCFIGKLNHKLEIMSNETIDKIAENYHNYLEKEKITKATIIFYGGEPLTAFNTIKYAVSKLKCFDKIEWNFAIVTNLTLLTAEIIDFFKENDFSVGISIDGPKETNDANRVFNSDSNRSVYDVVIKNLQLLKKNGIKNIGLSITLTDEILNDKKFLKWLKDLGINDINYNLLHFTKQTNEWNNYYKKATKFLFKSNSFLSRFNVIDDRLQRKIRAFNSKEFKYNDCGAIGGHQLCFAPNGDVTVCHGFWNSQKQKCGNIKINTIEDLIETKTFKQWQNNLTINKRNCLKCPAIYICGGGCAMQSSDLFNNIEEIDKAFCVHTKYSLKKLLNEKLKEAKNVI